jgi:hypothetical protein
MSIEDRSSNRFLPGLVEGDRGRAPVAFSGVRLVNWVPEILSLDTLEAPLGEVGGRIRFS